MIIPLAWLIIFFILLCIFLVFVCWCFFVVCQTPGTQRRFEDDLYNNKDPQPPKTQSSINLEVETIKIRQLEVMVESTNVKPVPTAPAAEDVDSGGGGEGSANNCSVYQNQTLDTPDIPKSEGDNLAPTEVVVVPDKELEAKNEKSVENTSKDNLVKKKFNPVYETMI